MGRLGWRVPQILLPSDTGTAELQRLCVRVSRAEQAGRGCTGELPPRGRVRAGGRSFFYPKLGPYSNTVIRKTTGWLHSVD